MMTEQNPSAAPLVPASSSVPKPDPYAGMTRAETIALKNKRTGVLIFQLSWIMVFVCLIVVNFQIRSNFVTWPPAGIAALDRFLPTIATVALLISAFTAANAWRAIRQGDIARFLQQWTITLALGILFLLIMAVTWAAAGFTGQYSTVFRLMVAYHAVHALVIGYIMIRVYRTARAGGYDAQHHWGIEGSTKLWYFVVVAWIMFYAALYVL